MTRRSVRFRSRRKKAKSATGVPKKDHGGDDRHALKMAALRLSRLLRKPHLAKKDETAMENLARYIIWASFSQERMTYLDQEATVVYAAKDGKDTKVFPAPEWLGMFTHPRADGALLWLIQQRLTGEKADDGVPCILESLGDANAFRKNWARLIQKIYEIDPLVCPKCQGTIMNYDHLYRDPEYFKVGSTDTSLS